MCVYDIRRFAMTTSCTLNSIEKKRSKSLAIRFFFSTNKKPCIYQLLGHTIVIESNLASSLCITDTQWTLLATCRILGVIYVNSSTTKSCDVNLIKTDFNQIVRMHCECRRCIANTYMWRSAMQVECDCLRMITCKSHTVATIAQKLAAFGDFLHWGKVVDTTQSTMNSE